MCSGFNHLNISLWSSFAACPETCAPLNNLTPINPNLASNKYRCAAFIGFGITSAENTTWSYFSNLNGSLFVAILERIAPSSP